MSLPPGKSLQPWFQTVGDVGPVINWSTLFEKDQPVEIDIGSGRGLFLLTAAQQHPDRNFAGLEIDFTEGRRAAERLVKRSLPNARVIGGDANRMLAEMIPPASVDSAHVYFPDPWWKTRHHKRRIFNPAFTQLLARVVKPGGFVHHWTDVADYFQMVRGLMDPHPEFVTCTPPEERDASNDMDYQTSFERKKRKLGFPIYRALWQRR
ncbi:MAG: tRNA (guanosine(46)-N7)-methyltransferase TrmB [Planctomyces sp.]|jgi:tRNA (guanine-N7-)-methyltransferase